MSTKVFMEALSPTMEEGRLVKWLKAEGDAVKSGDVLAEVETDKAVMELVARGDGILRKQLITEGTTAAVSSLVGIIAGADEDISALLGGAAAPAAAAGSTPTASSQSTQSAQSTAPATLQSSASAAVNAVPTDGRITASPLARKLAGDAGLDIRTLQGSGPGGRIIKRDIEAALRSDDAGRTSPATAMPAASVIRHPSSGEAFRDEPLTQIRKTIAKRLSESLGPIPTFFLTAEFDLSRAAELRSAAAELGDAYKVSFNDIILKAVATALTQHPEVNAHWLGDKIRYFNTVHLGMAVATDDGLIVPVIFDAQTKGMAQISAEAKVLAKKARERKLKPEEFTGSTFSVSNLGMMQIDQFTAIINPPEAAILAIGAIENKVQVGADGGFEVRKKLRVTM
ncbi:MAG TPA: dihydrolipoamide acetyltransferase family protein, partial [Gemmatimonadaceae bacterium]|nr:dihydrolipoamide acetyltransferase family protein [Gemmatimonadaceae bacterium]